MTTIAYLNNYLYIQNVKDRLDKIKKTFDLNNAYMYEFEKVIEFAEMLFSMAKFKIEDRVAINKDLIVIYNNGGKDCSHDFVAGSAATIVGICPDKNGFEYTIILDKERWRDSKGELHDLEPKTNHFIKECDLCLLSDYIKINTQYYCPPLISQIELTEALQKLEK